MPNVSERKSDFYVASPHKGRKWHMKYLICLLCGHDISPFITIFDDGKVYKRCRRCGKEIMGNMKISKTECDKDFAEKKLELSVSKCKECKYFYLCPYIPRSYNDVVYGDLRTQ